ncbi:MAG: sulfur carrier protein ThiS [Candidatus Polarisedimenticolia bacterium]
MSITIRLNGQDKEVEAGLTLDELLRRLELPDRRVAVERNLHVVPRERYGSTRVEAGDRLEIVTLVGGG